MNMFPAATPPRLRLFCLCPLPGFSNRPAFARGGLRAQVDLCAIITPAAQLRHGLPLLFPESAQSHAHSCFRSFTGRNASGTHSGIGRSARKPYRIVTSGAALSEAELARLRAVLAALPDNVRPRVCASLGRLNSAQLEQLAQAGLTRYHHNLETAQGHYPRVCTTQTWEQRRDTVAHAMRVGLTACTGACSAWVRAGKSALPLLSVSRPWAYAMCP